MIEIIAKAIYEALDRQGGYVGEYKEGQTTLVDGDFDLRLLAHDALIAMLEPDSNLTAEWDDYVIEAYKSVIRTALK